MSRVTRRGLFMAFIFAPLLTLGGYMVRQEVVTGTVVPALLFGATWVSAIMAGRAQARASHAPLDAGPVPVRARLAEFGWLFGTIALLLTAAWSATVL